MSIPLPQVQTISLLRRRLRRAPPPRSTGSSATRPSRRNRNDPCPAGRGCAYPSSWPRSPAAVRLNRRAMPNWPEVQSCLRLRRPARFGTGLAAAFARPCCGAAVAVRRSSLFITHSGRRLAVAPLPRLHLVDRWRLSRSIVYGPGGIFVLGPATCRRLTVVLEENPRLHPLLKGRPRPPAGRCRRRPVAGG